MKKVGDRVVPGETVDSLVEAIREANGAGLTATANYLGESEKNEAAPPKNRPRRRRGKQKIIPFKPIKPPSQEPVATD